MSSHRRILTTSMLILAASTICAAAIAMTVLYRTAFGEERNKLMEIARSQARLIEAGVRHDMIRSDWRLPEIGCHAIRHQDAPESTGAEPGSPPDRLTRILHLCGLIARITTQLHVAHDLPRSMILKARVLGIPPEVTHHLFDQVVEEWQTTSQIFDVSSREVPSLAEIYLQAQQLREAMV